METEYTHYQLKSEREHVLSNPDTYVGSAEMVEHDDFTVVDGESIKRVEQNYVPALLNLFNEVIVNARDHVVRMIERKGTAVTCIEVNVNQDTGMISVKNDGDGIPIMKHPEHDMWIPTMIFGHMRTSSNYDKSEKKIVGGKNGFGVKLVMIWSHEGMVETVDHYRGKIFTQKFCDHLSIIESPTIKSSKVKPFTRVTFRPDIERLGMTKIDDTMVALFKKRVYDIAAVTLESVRVRFNGEQLGVRNFLKYTELYDETLTRSQRAHESPHPRWEYVIVPAPRGEFESVSFVNGIYTSKGGKHVECVLNQIVSKIIAYLKAKKKVDAKPSSVKEHIMLFLRCDIENPCFDSQTKDCLNSPISSFGSKPVVSDKFIEKLVKMGIGELATATTALKETKQAKKTDGTMSLKIRGIPKLVDANKAGTKKESHMCKLILCEGDSAKAAVISGMQKHHRDYIGVYPLKGKLFNVREKTTKRVSDNTEITQIKQILGLENGRRYTAEDIKSRLRYGQVVFLTDQDLDGSHIKGLCINMFHELWHALTTIPGFLCYINTPIVKAWKGNDKISFYSIQEFEKWRAITSGKWKVKYYKGLGTSTAGEFREYFESLRLVEFAHTSDSDDMIDKMFNKKRAVDRKEAIMNHDPNRVLDISKNQVTFEDFVMSDLIHFSAYDCRRALPSCIDGLKVSLRKILFAAFKRNLVEEIKVAQFSGYVSEVSGYHHGEASLNGAIVGMAQTYVGSNNINHFMPNGQFGTRLLGGRDSASERYIFTQLNPLVTFLYPSIDLPVLTYCEDDGIQVEPVHYAPVIPMLIVNGSKGIGTGFSAHWFPHHPLSVINYVRQLLTNVPVQELVPYFHGFLGTVTKMKDNYLYVKGVYTLSKGKVHITELPIYTWTHEYTEFIEDCYNSGFLTHYIDNSTDQHVDIVLTLAETPDLSSIVVGVDTYGNDITATLLEKKLKMYTTYSMNNLHAYDAKGTLKHFEHVSHAIDVYIHERRDLYAKRLAYQLVQLTQKADIASNRARFIEAVNNGKVKIRDRSIDRVNQQLQEQGFSKKDDKYMYLIDMPMRSMTSEQVAKLCEERDKILAEMKEISSTTPEDAWLRDLKTLETALKPLFKL